MRCSSRFWPVDVAVIECEFFSAAEQKPSPGSPRPVDGEDGGEPPRGVPHHHPAIQAQVVRQRSARQVTAKEPAELLFGPENQAPDGGMQAVSPDDEVEPVGRGVLERHLHTVGLLDQASDRVLKQVPCVAAGRLIEDARQLTPHDLHVPA